MQPETGPVLSLQSVYLKDCSYEAPNGPRVEGNWNPQINLDLHTAATAVTPDAARGRADGDRLRQAERATPCSSWRSSRPACS